jgi:hypothetical protein
MRNRRKTIAAAAALALTALLCLPPLQACTGPVEPPDTSPAPTETLPDPGPARTEPPDTGTEPAVVETDFIATPDEPDVFTVLCGADALKLDGLVAEQGAGTDDPLRLRQERLLAEYGVTLARRTSLSVADFVSRGALSGSDGADIMLAAATELIGLMHSGLLQDLSVTGIGLGEASEGVRTRLTRDLSFGGRVCMLFCDALTSDIGSSYCLEVRIPDGATQELTEGVAALCGLASSGGFTAGAFIAAQKELAAAAGVSDFFSVPDVGTAASLLAAAGGRIFTLSTLGVPGVSVRTASFRTAYETLSALCAAGGKEEGPARAVPAGNVKKGSALLPLPKADAVSRYVSYTDLSGCAAFAAPSGVVRGRRLAGLMSLLCSCSDGVREAALDRIVSGVPEDFDGDGMLKLVVDGQTAETAVWYGWGDLGEFIAGAAASGRSYTELTSDKDLSAREKAASAAIAIISERMAAAD